VTESAQESWASRNVSPDELAAAVKEAPLAALMEVRAAFVEHELWAWPDGTGGAHVAIDGINLGEFWAHETSWFAFTINHLYPDADTYPHYVRGDLARASGEALVAPFHIGHTFHEQPAVMVSRSSPKRVSGLSTAARKALTVISFIQSQKAVTEETA
jgi:hypothetical protein